MQPRLYSSRASNVHMLLLDMNAEMLASPDSGNWSCHRIFNLPKDSATHIFHNLIDKLITDGPANCRKYTGLGFRWPKFLC